MPRQSLPLFFSADTSPVGTQARSESKRAFAEYPFDWYLRHFDEVLEQVRSGVGTKVRIAYPDLGALDRMLPTLLVLADLVVVSPPPLWLCQYAELSARAWPGFIDGSEGTYGATQAGPRHLMFHLRSSLEEPSFTSWLIRVRPLLEQGLVAYLPRCDDEASDRAHRWSHPRIRLPALPERDLATPEGTRQTVLEDLLCEHAVSEQLGCIHVDATTAKTPMLIPSLAGWQAQSDSLVSRVLARLQIPHVCDVPLHDLLQVLQQEEVSVRAFRRSVRKALRELERTDPNKARLPMLVAELQEDLINVPFAALNRRLQQGTRMRVKKHAAYAGAAVFASVLCYVGEPVLAAAALSGVSIPTIMEKYYGDVERDIGLNADALFWLTQVAAIG